MTPGMGQCIRSRRDMVNRGLVALRTSGEPLAHAAYIDSQFVCQLPQVASTIGAFCPLGLVGQQQFQHASAGFLNTG